MGGDLNPTPGRTRRPHVNSVGPTGVLTKYLYNKHKDRGRDFTLGIHQNFVQGNYLTMVMMIVMVMVMMVMVMVMVMMVMMMMMVLMVMAMMVKMFFQSSST